MSGSTSALFATASSAASPYVQVIVGSKFALSGVALTLAGFFGIFGVVSLQPQNAIISAYVCFFGLVRCLLVAAPRLPGLPSGSCRRVPAVVPYLTLRLSVPCCIPPQTLVTFAISKGNETLVKYFGFMYRENGQLYFLLVAGNLAWTTGLLGILAAIFTNFVAYVSWQNAVAEGSSSVPQLPPWLGGPSAATRETASATGMVDMQNDELL